MTRRQKIAWTMVGVVAVIVGARIAAPYLILDYVNQTLADLDGYSGEVEDIDLNLWRGAYQIEGVRLVTTDSEVQEPFLILPRTDISVQWPALLRGSVVAEIVLYKPEMHFVTTESESTAVQAKGSDNWQDQVKGLAPLKINRVALHDGELHFRDPHSQPKVDIYLANVDLVIENLTNSRNLSKSMEATLTVDALAMGSGKLHVNGRVDPFAKKTTFAADMKLEGLELAELNDLTRAYANVDIERGTLDLYAEMEAKKGELSGYAKPFVDKLKVVKWQQEKEPFFGKLWEAIVGGAAELLENQPRDSVATKIPLHGSIDTPDANVWITLAGVLKHAFFGALSRSLDA